MKKIFLLIGILPLLLLLILEWNRFYEKNFPSKSNQNLLLSIKEKIVLSLDEKQELYSYDFQWSTFHILNIWKDDSRIIKINTSTNQSLKNSQSKDLSIRNWKVLLEWKNIFSCYDSSCPHYINKTNKYIIFVDRVYYEWIFRQQLWYLSLRVLDTEKLEYKNFPILELNGEKVSISWMIWYLE